MGHYKKVLVAFDGSETSKNALRQAIRFDPGREAEIEALTVNPLYMGDLEYIGASNIQDLLREQGEKTLTGAKEIAREEGASITTRLEQGDVFKRIIDTAAEEHSDLIVVGRRGMTRLERVFMGSVTEKIIGHSPRTVLVVPRGSMSECNNILLATDGSSYSEAAAAEALTLVKFRGGKCAFHAIAVAEQGAAEEKIQTLNRALENIRSKANKEGIEADTLLSKGRPHESIYEEIIEYAKEKNADIIVMGSHGRTVIQRLLIGSVAERVIGHTYCPVMVVKTG